MSSNRIKFFVLLHLLIASVFAVLSSAKSHAVTPPFSPAIPRVWDDAEMAVLQLPLVDSTASPKQISADYYYRIPVRTIYKNYPVYEPGKEPAGYIEWLKQQEPQSAFDAGALKTESDWIRAGELVFDSAISYGDIAQIADVRNPQWYEKLRVPATKDGTLPWFRYVIREIGKVELGTISCALCHAAKDFRTLPDPSKLLRNSDEQLYALALYIYSLKPPPNPNKFDRLASRGQKIFEREGCAGCHTPPLYTSNALVAVDGFDVPEDHRRQYDILRSSVGTDPRLAMQTRRGTGYYKVPSLKGVWYRGPFEHNGSVATLEDWFDPRRLSADYVPTGFKGAGVNSRAVKGHPFGLDLKPSDRQALIAFLKTL